MSGNEEVPIELSWEPPGPGIWELEATHHGRRPVSPFIRDTMQRAATSGTRALMARYGLPLTELRFEFVNGCAYARPQPVGEGDRPSAPPPAPIMKLVARVHPELRRRNRTAKRAWQERRWRREVDAWFSRERAGVVEQNLRFQSVDLSGLDDTELAAHVTELLDHFELQARMNMDTHGGDLIPVGDYLAHCADWGVDHATAAALLRGSSPATIETAQLLAPVATAVAEAAVQPGSMDEVRSLHPDVHAAIDRWMELHGWRLVTTDDIDKPTLAERPGLQLRVLLNATSQGDESAPDPSAVRARVPEADRDRFDELLAEARYGMTQRDDVVGVRWNWAGGLLRRALLEAGNRLTDRSRLEQADHVVELEPAELTELLVSGHGPTAGDVAARASARDFVEASSPPDTLGDPEPPPPIDAFPAPMARATRAVLAVLEAEGLAGAAADDPLTGLGIGSSVYRGRARVATTADDALDRLEPGDVLVAAFTGPSYNSIIPLLGGLVVDAGGSMCHAAIVAREFGLPAIIGARGATTLVPDGAVVELDPVNGQVLVISEERAAVGVQPVASA